LNGSPYCDITPAAWCAREGGGSPPNLERGRDRCADASITKG
jgi:hypothetical protein